MQWNRVDKGNVPVGQVLRTKIEDKDGLRNQSDLIFDGKLWFLKDKSMYVYYTPTHWAYKEA